MTAPMLGGCQSEFSYTGGALGPGAEFAVLGSRAKFDPEVIGD
jgi:hypothetical protein